MSLVLDRKRPKSEAQTLSCEEGSAPLNHPHLGDLLETFCVCLIASLVRCGVEPRSNQPMDFDFGEDFIDHLEAGDPYGRAGMDSLFQRPQALTSILPSPTEHTERTLILRQIRATTGSKISFSYLADYAQSIGLDGTKLAQIITDLIRLGHVALIDEGHQSGFSFTALP